MTDERTKFAPAPYPAALQAGDTYLLCTCGYSLSPPICDGIDKSPACAPLSFVARATERTLLCGCNESDDLPYCDGRHNTL